PELQICAMAEHCRRITTRLMESLPLPIPTTHSMSPWTLIADASLLVQLVMLILVLASIISWFLIVQRSSLMGSARRSLTRFERSFWSKDTDLGQMYQQQRDELARQARIFLAGYRLRDQHISYTR